MPVTQTDPELKTRHRAMWASGDYPSMVETWLLPLGPRLVDAAGIGAGIRVLDVANRYSLAGDGATTTLTQTLEASGGGLKGRVFIPMIQPHLERKLEADLAALAQLLAQKR